MAQDKHRDGWPSLLFFLTAVATVPVFGAGIGTLAGRKLDGAVWTSVATIGLFILIAFGSAFYVNSWR
jgi:hypothetical protein